MRIAEQIKELLTVEDVVRHYDMEFCFGPVRNRRMLCPFHAEKTPSLQIHRNNRSWKCYGCGAGGTVIDFVMRLYQINFGQACIRLSSDFDLRLTNGRESAPERSRICAARLRKQKEEQSAAELYDALAGEYRRMQWLDAHLPDTGEEDVALYRTGLRTEMQVMEQAFYDYDFMGDRMEWLNRYGFLQKKIF